MIKEKHGAIQSSMSFLYLRINPGTSLHPQL